jgi:hypothetical protein
VESGGVDASKTERAEAAEPYVRGVFVCLRHVFGGEHCGGERMENESCYI